MKSFHVSLEPRLVPASRALHWGLPVAGVAAALAICALLLLATGHDPLTAFGALLRSAAGSSNAFYGLVNKTVPILLCAIGISIALRARLWNIGAEGQIYAGALCAAWVGLTLPSGVPAPVGILLALFAGAFGGAILVGIAAVLRAGLGVSEILSTLMLNYIAILLVGYLVSGPWADPMTFGMPYTPMLSESVLLPDIIGTIHFGVVPALLALGLLLFIERRTGFGYRLRVFGDAPRAALYGGVASRRLILTSLVLSGLIAGIAGMIEVTGAAGRLQAGLSPGYGFVTILVAALARGRALPVLLCSILYAALLNGGFSLQVSGVPPAIATLMQRTVVPLRMVDSDCALDKDKKNWMWLKNEGGKLLILQAGRPARGYAASGSARGSRQGHRRRPEPCAVDELPPCSSRDADRHKRIGRAAGHP
jgi:simple sugar transport system permease protein